MGSFESDLVIIGAGAKAAAIAAKVHVINSLGLGPVSLTIVESTEPAASWSGRNGLTSGDEPLAVTPVKDVAFPYQSHQVFGEHGEAIDREMLGFSWQRFLIVRRTYSRWVDAGSPPIPHREYGEYLTWVLSQASEGVTLQRGRVNQVLLEGERWLLDGTDASGEMSHRCTALTVTGPGVHRPISHDPEAAGMVFHCDSRRVELARIPTEEPCDIAIVGGGESALSTLALLRPQHPQASFTVYTPGLPMSRGESFLENRVFSNPDSVEWSSLSSQTRRDFIRHCDRGVFDPGTLAQLAYDERCRFVTGRVKHIAAASRAERVQVDYTASGGMQAAEHDYVVNCIGFDLLEHLRMLLSDEVRQELERRVGPLWERPPEAEIPIGRNLELLGMTPRLHVPGLAALSQGPGFANLGSMGVLANRVLEPLFSEKPNNRKQPGQSVRESGLGVV